MRKPHAKSDEFKFEHRYKHGKILTPLNREQFEAALDKETQLCYRSFIVLLYYTGVRVSEALRAVKEDFRVTHATLYWDVGKRLKHGRKTPPLPLSLEQTGMHYIIEQIGKTKKEQRVFDFDRTTAWRHVKKAGLGYNHLARLTAITFFLKSGYSVAHIVNWFGISVQTVNSYIGELDLEKMGTARR